MKLLLPLKLTTVFPDVKSAPPPPLPAILLMKLMTPRKPSTVFSVAKIAPPPVSREVAELLAKWLLPLKLSVALFVANIARSLLSY